MKRSLLALAAVLAVVLAIVWLLRPPARTGELTGLAGSADPSRRGRAVAPLEVDPVAQASEADARVGVGREPGLEPAANDPALDARPAVSRPPTGARVHGRVVDERSGRPIEAATLTLHVAEPVSVRNATTGPSGRFEFAGVEPETWFVYAQAPGWAPRRVEVRVGARDPDELVLALTARPVVIVRLLGDDGAPLSRAFPEGVPDLVLVESDRSLGAEWTPGEETSVNPILAYDAVVQIGFGPSHPASPWLRDRPGRDPLDTLVMIDGPVPCHVAACRDGAVLAEAVVASLEPQVVDLVVPLGRLAVGRTVVRFRLVAADSGAPIAGARARLVRPRQYDPGKYDSDAGGVVEIETDVGGARWLTAEAEGYQRLQREVVVPAGEPKVDLGTFALTGAARIRGRVVGASAGCMDVLAYSLERFEEDRKLPNPYGQSSGPPDSRWELKGLGRGKYVLRVGNEGWAALPVVVDTSAGDVDDVEIQAERGTEVRFELGEPRADGLLRVETADRLPVGELPIDGARSLALRLVPGRYAWRLDLPNAPGAREELEVGPRDLVVSVPRDVGR